jgi:hypothetical protein
MDKSDLRKFYWLTGILGIVLAGLVVWLVLDLNHLYSTGALRPSASHLRRQRTMAIMSPSQIQSWMTFRYINYVFRLPENYLSKTLNISDTYYPNLVISTYAGSHKLNNAAFLANVKQAVIAYPPGGSQ